VRRRELIPSFDRVRRAGAPTVRLRLAGWKRRNSVAKLSLWFLLAGLSMGLSGVVSPAETLPRSVLILDESGPGALNPGYAEISRAFDRH
jgi:hypothetical protein